FVDVEGVRQPAPAPRFSRTASAIGSPPERPGTSTATALARWGIDEARIARLRDAGAFSAT
ncbi:MAG TPA: CoA transferase, partial [Acidimicrobiales bacterium]|nr:CoA transferase [Acidimicrobiales bacterium]